MENRKIILKFRAANLDIFDAIVSGKKKIETRAGTERYRQIKIGDTVVLKCGVKTAEKKVSKVELFSSITAILKKYKPETINPNTHNAKEARDTWNSFPGYREKIKKYGLIAMSLE